MMMWGATDKGGYTEMHATIRQEAELRTMTAAETIAENTGLLDTLLVLGNLNDCPIPAGETLLLHAVIIVLCGGSVIHDGTNDCCMQLRVPT